MCTELTIAVVKYETRAAFPLQTMVLHALYQFIECPRIFYGFQLIVLIIHCVPLKKKAVLLI